MKMKKNQCKKADNSKRKNWMENKINKLTEAGFRRWVITNSSELKEHVLTHARKLRTLKKGYRNCSRE